MSSISSFDSHHDPGMEKWSLSFREIRCFSKDHIAWSFQNLIFTFVFWLSVSFIVLHFLQNFPNWRQTWVFRSMCALIKLQSIRHKEKLLKWPWKKDYLQLNNQRLISYFSPDTGRPVKFGTLSSKCWGTTTVWTKWPT